ncbi:translation initiation factor IF-2 chloroplastic [Tripterygium wilfordii]|uniref:Translation initiation factor IF-2, chloroplastic n=1 Tax=Tripterygium wilfordii TaxID=458696 RepID=A0A7J7C2Q7_TRIWF|nr:translation initiation factor IF-2, chloroplastic-like [Tripterygium wilfordii]KAF5728215.1 translation initiation factor IF-2 chloroplastic [Tripterygium wilfordii]
MVLVGTMATLASLASLGNASVVVTSSSEKTPSYILVRRVPLLSRVKVISRCICKYSVTTADFITEKGNSRYRGSNDSNTEIALRPAPKPVLKSKGEPLLGVNSVRWKSGDDDEEEKEKERSKVIESLGEVLEKAERLEASNSGLGTSISGSSNSSTRKQSGGSVNQFGKSNSTRVGKAVDSMGTRNAKASKSVWRKGDSVAQVEKVVREPVKDNRNVVKEEPKMVRGGQVQSRPSVPFRPAQRSPMLAMPQPTLQAKPSIAPPPVLKKTVILKDVGAASRHQVNDDLDAGVKSKERRPILVDKFRTKKPVVDPLIAAAVLAPPKPAKGKFKDDYRKKSISDGAARRRIVEEDDDVEIHDEESSELNVPIPRALAARKGRKWTKASRKAARLQAAKDAAPVKVDILEVGEKGMLIEELAYSLAISEGEIFGHLYAKGIKPDGVQTLDKDMVKMICKEHEVEVLDVDPVKVEEMAKKNDIIDEEDLENLENRPPVLTIMGHVDHGKTTLLDYIRKSKVAAAEAGGITQGIGAYKVLVPVDEKLQPCVFLDTPGHEAFGAMRARGARVTDIAVIVVAADDGIRPQTNEAVAHAKAAGVPIVIAINKIDKDGANQERVMQELSSIGLMPEHWGGDIPMVPISALKGENVYNLLETIMLVAELQELKANPHRNAKGTVIEAGLEKSKGPVATFLVQNGTLRKGDIIVCGGAFGKVRALFDDGGNRVDEAGPSIPVQVIGLNNVPLAGDKFEVVSSLDIAREKAEMRAESLRNERIAAKAGDGKVTLSSLASAVASGKLTGLDLHQLNIIMKVDVQGSTEAVSEALQVLPQDNVVLKFLLQATGDVSASDVDLAVASKAIIFGFNVRAPGSVKSYADSKGVEIRLYKVIYELIDDVREAMEGLLEPVKKEVTIGSAEIRATFSSGSGRIAGCMVTEGRVVSGCGVRVIRNGKVVHVDILNSLRRVKETVKEVNAGLECGIAIDHYSDYEEGDILEAFNTVEKKRTLEEAAASMAAALENL